VGGKPGFGQTRSQAVADKFARAPGQGQAKPQKPRRPAAPTDNRQKGFTKGPKAPTISRDTADQLTHLGSATEEDSRFLNKVENAVGDRAYDRGGITRTPTRKQSGYEDSRSGRSRGRGSRDRGRSQRQEPIPVVIKNITLDGPTTVTDFARLLGKKTGDIIKKLISYGIMVNINQELDIDTLTLLGQDFGTQVETRVTKEDILTATDEPDTPENLKERPPVVTIMGHVDHGKTSLLDAIRQANVQATEAGGITQHIGAYQVEINNRKITFLDTPGHEAFTAMRARGAQCTDIAILVVAADDGVMPRTVEVINHVKAASVPIIVAINKMDKEGANPERIKQELTEYGLVAEEWGGETVFAEVSAKTKQGLDQLLEMILLVADVGDLRANPSRKAKGVVIEGKLDKGRGPVATVLVQNGTLVNGDFLIAGTAQGRIRAMNDERGRNLTSAEPSTPVEVVGLSEVPQAGDAFQVVEDERLAKQIASERTAVKREEIIHSRSRISLDDLFAQIQTGEVKDLNIIIKADVQGSIEALKTSLEKLSNEEVRVQTIHQGVGGITEADVDFASASNAIILGFNVRPDVNARKSAESNQVDIRLYRVIYNAIEDVKSALSGLLKPEIRENLMGRAEVRQVIRVPKVGAIAGCYILDGKITRACQVRVIRDNIVLHESSIGSLRRFKDDVREVATGFECGIGIERFNDFQEGDVIEGFVMEEIKRELA
jgi:translation initiation factor IF-2